MIDEKRKNILILHLSIRDSSIFKLQKNNEGHYRTTEIIT